MAAKDSKYYAQTLNAHQQLSEDEKLLHPGRMFEPLRHKGEITRHNQKMFLRGMLKRDKFDYALAEWERASFKHRRVLDEYFQTWITTDPNHNNVTDVDLRQSWKIAYR